MDIGPLISEERRQTVHEQVSEAVLFGARLLRGGQIPDGPGTSTRRRSCSTRPKAAACSRRRRSARCIPIVAVESIERAIENANDSAYALTASGWTKSEDTAERLMVGLQAGVVTINDVLYAYGEPAATWSGFKRSGLGASHGLSGLKEMSRRRFVVVSTARRPKLRPSRSPTVTEAGSTVPRRHGYAARAEPMDAAAIALLRPVAIEAIPRSRPVAVVPVGAARSASP